MQRNLLLLTIVIVAFFSFNFQCGKDKELIDKQEELQNIEMLMDIYPVKKKYAIGDTIWIDANLPDRMLSDAKNNTKILIDTVRFNIPFIFKVVTKQTLVPSGGFCEFINPQQLQLATSSGYYDSKYNVYWNYNTGTLLHFGCSESPSAFKVGIQLNTRGAFYIGLSGSSLFSCDNKGALQNKYLSFKFNEPDLNLQVYNDLPKLPENDPYWIGFDVNLLNDKKAFIVQVE